MDIHRIRVGSSNRICIKVIHNYPPHIARVYVILTILLLLYFNSMYA